MVNRNERHGQHPDPDNAAAAAGSESPEEGEAAMEAAEDATVNDGDD